jgi:uncharacterized protein YggT (Ycf19 family)
MAEYTRRVKEVRTNDDVTGSTVVEGSTQTTTSGDGQSFVARIIWYIAGVLLSILALRFLLALLGANPANPFANFVYSITYPFVAPFFSLFSYNMQYGVSTFEIYTLVAMVLYAIIAAGIARLVTLNQPE